METVLTFGALEIRAFTVSEKAFLFRIGTPKDQPEKTDDAFYPSRDLGFLWFRYVDGRPACSGMIRKGALDRRKTDELLEFLDTEIIRSGAQICSQIAFVEALETQIESGEESITC